jgi:hypothetical protein
VKICGRILVLLNVLLLLFFFFQTHYLQKERDELMFKVGRECAIGGVMLARLEREGREDCGVWRTEDWDRARELADSIYARAEEGW